MVQQFDHKFAAFLLIRPAEVVVILGDAIICGGILQRLLKGCANSKIARKRNVHILYSVYIYVHTQCMLIDYTVHDIHITI